MKTVSWQWTKANPDAAARRIRNLEREVAALREDWDRLSWLEDKCSEAIKEERYLRFCVSWGHTTIRAAIDAARCKEAKP